MNRTPGIATVCTVALALASATACARLDQSEIADLFSQGKELFREANDIVADNPEAGRELYRKAAMRFERIAREGHIRNGKLYYNIGNAYFRMQDIGRAILYYRKAQRYTPHDVNLQQNLQAARARRVDRIPEPQQKIVLKTVFFWHYDLSAPARSIVFIAAFIAFWAGAAVRLWWRPPGLGWALAVLAFVATLFLASLVIETIEWQRQRPGVILARQVVARKGDGESFEKSFTEPLHAGTEFVLLEDRGDWLNVRLQDGRTCWIPAPSAELVR